MRSADDYYNEANDDHKDEYAFRIMFVMLVEK